MFIKPYLALICISLLLSLSSCIMVPHEPVVIKPAPVVIKAKPRRVVAAPVRRITPVARVHFPTVIYLGHENRQSDAELIQEQVDLGANFNDHYRVVALSCGDNCIDNLIIDVSSGEIIEEFRACGAAEFSLNSNIINIPMRSEDNGQCELVSYQLDEAALNEASTQ